MSSKPVRHGKKWRVRWKDYTGRRRSAVYKTFKAAEQALRRKLIETEEINLGLCKPESQVKTFNQAADHWEAHRSSRKKRPEDDKYMLNAHLRPAFGHLPLGEITTEIVDKFVSTLDLAPNTIKNNLTLLISILRMSLDNQWIDRVPKIKKPGTHMLSTDFKYLHSWDEVNRLLIAARAIGERIFMMFSIAVFSGMRAGEIAGLKWSDVDFQKRIITIQRSFDKTTKTNRVRYIPILDQLLPALREWRLKNNSEWVVPNSIGGMHKSSDRIIQELFHKCLEQAELPRIRFHDLRHSFASLWVKSGGDIFRLQIILGHSTISMTMRYAHLAPEYFAEDFSRFGDFLFGQSGEVLNINEKTKTGGKIK